MSPRRITIAQNVTGSAAAILIVITGVAVVVQSAVRRLQNTAADRYRDGYAEGYIAGLSDRTNDHRLRLVSDGRWRGRWPDPSDPSDKGSDAV